MIETLTAAMDRAVSALEDHRARDVTIVHHNDTDGLTSGAILVEAFTSCGYTPHRFSLEKPYPHIVHTLLEDAGNVVVFADFAGKIAPMIAKENGGRNLVLILDHHPAEDTDDPSVYNLDGDLHGLKGDRDISGSATCFLFAQLLMQRYGRSADHLAHLGALGAIGDGFFVDGALSGVNRTVHETACRQRLMRAEPHTDGETYFVTLAGDEYPAERLCNLLDTIGGVGYYDDGPARGIDVCRSGISREIETYAQSLEELKERLFSAEIHRLQTHINTTAHLQWFDLQDRFQPMGVKMVGVFCMTIKEREFLDHDKYLAGFQHVPNSVPGFGTVPIRATKISMRVSTRMTERIRTGASPGLDTFLPAATHELGGFADACHSLSAATTVEIGQEEALIKGMEAILAQRKATNGNR